MKRQYIAPKTLFVVMNTNDLLIMSVSGKNADNDLPMLSPARDDEEDELLW